LRQESALSSTPSADNFLVVQVNGRSIFGVEDWRFLRASSIRGDAMAAQPPSYEERVYQICRKYRDRAIHELRERWELWPLDPVHNEVHEVVGALLARQTTLSVELVGGPPMWTPHIAPIVLRSMVDLQISLLQDPVVRSQRFVVYGLGQAKLRMEHRRAETAEAGGDPDADPLVKATRGWLNSQRFHFLTEVNVGNWAETDLRKTAQECGCEQLYRNDYVSWSACTHNMWHHVQLYSLRRCSNPLHRGGHRVPDIPELGSDADYGSLCCQILGSNV
jgi:hypothetical protein